jgi:hypothetical protein
MRILVLHGPTFRDLWRRQGHDVLSWGPYPQCDLRQRVAVVGLADVLAELPPRWNPDLILFGDDCRLLAVTGLEDAPCATAMLSVDAHHNAMWHAPLACAFDEVFVAQGDYLPAYVDAGARRARWLPCWAPDGLPAPAAEKSYEVAFVGTLDPALNPERVALLAALRPRLPLHAASGDWVPVFGRSRIVLNQTVKGDMNARVFEAMASGALLLTERTGNGLLELFADGVHLVTYPRGDVEAVVTLATRYLADEVARAAIAARGRAAVLAAHLESHRGSEVLAAMAASPGPYPDPVRLAGAARGYAVAAHYAGLVAGRLQSAAHGPIRQRQLAAAAALAARPALGETDRRAVLGLVALVRGQLAAARDHLAWAARHGGRVEDHVASVEVELRAGNLRAAREAVERLRAAHPGYEVGGALAESMALLGAPPEAPASAPAEVR